MYIQTHEDGTFWRQVKPLRNFAFGPNHFQPPETLTSEEAALLRVFPLTLTVRPTAIGQVAEESTPALIDGIWTQQWTLRVMTADELATAAQALQDSIVNATQARLDAFAATRGYSSTESISKYKDITDAEIAALPVDEQVFVRKFRAECRYFAVAIASTWARLYFGLAEVQTGKRPMPTSFADIEADLPALVWPA